jgi:predicted transposase YdaD
MIDHDQIFKQLLSAFFFEFIELFFPDLAAYLDRSSISFLDKELYSRSDDRKVIADLVIKARCKGNDSFFLIHVEHQAQHQVDFSSRFLHYFARLHKQYKLPIYPIVVFSFTRPHRQQPDTFEVSFPDFHVLGFHYRTVQLNRLNWRQYIRHENPVAAALMARMKFAPHERAEVKLQCLRLITTLKLDRDKSGLIVSFIDTYLAMTAMEHRQFEDSLKKLDDTQQEEIMATRTTWRDQAWKEGRAEGQAVGRAEGQAVGRAEGRAEEAISLISRQLSRRFGPLDGPLQEKIRALPLEKLEQLAEAVLDFATAAELHQWLTSPDQSS